VVFDDANKLVYAIGGAKVNILSASALGTAGAPATLPLKGTIDFAVLDKPAGGTPEGEQSDVWRGTQRESQTAQGHCFAGRGGPRQMELTAECRGRQ
jgi:hypothetical protein